jgi:Ca2+-binding EF-hand superfamily protein
MVVPTDACGMSVLKKLEQHPQQIRKAFEFIDDDKDGLITHKEVWIGWYLPAIVD